MFPDLDKYANLLPLLLNIPWEDMTMNQQLSVHLAYTLAHTKFSADPEVNLHEIFEKWGKYIEPTVYLEIQKKEIELSNFAEEIKKIRNSNDRFYYSSS